MAPSSSSSLNTRQLKWIALFAFASFLWKSFTQRAPFFLLPSIPALPTPHGCAVHHAAAVHACEDLATIPNSPLIVLSCDSSRRSYSHITGNLNASLPPGELFLYNPSLPSEPPRQLDVHTRDFRPLGISAVSTSPSSARLFIANQAAVHASVEVLDVDLSTAATTPVASLVHPRIASPNGIAALSPHGFYLTNDVASARRSAALVALELLLGVPGGDLVYVSFTPGSDAGTTVTRLARLAFANGLALDAATGRLWVASTLKGVYAYLFDAANPGTLLGGGAAFLRTPFLPDNLAFAGGELYVTGLAAPRLSAGFAASGDATPPPSIAAKLVAPLEKGAGKAAAALRGHDVSNTGLRREEWRWKTVFYDDGTLFGQVSGVAVDADGRFFGVGLFWDGVLVCDAVPVKGPMKVVEEEVKDEL
ncbi:hypothetical protein EDC01DRAFT_710756 [Geopyxis carbonaria]|nr:hypothetical protein EDC01DRAFT_710756 [Geopyxis carbonaria]